MKLKRFLLRYYPPGMYKCDTTLRVIDWFWLRFIVLGFFKSWTWRIVEFMSGNGFNDHSALTAVVTKIMSSKLHGEKYCWKIYLRYSNVFWFFLVQFCWILVCMSFKTQKTNYRKKKKKKRGTILLNLSMHQAYWTCKMLKTQQWATELIF